MMIRFQELLLVAVVALAGSLLANTSWNGTVDTSWTNAANWSDGVPGSNDAVTIGKSKPRYPVASGSINVGDVLIEGGELTISGGSFVCKKINVKKNGSAGVLTISGGSVAVNGEFKLEQNVSGSMANCAFTSTNGFKIEQNSTFNISNSTMSVSGGEFKYEQNTSGAISNSTVNVTGSMKWEQNATGSFLSCSVAVSGEFKLEQNGDMTICETSMTVGTTFKVEQNADLEICDDDVSGDLIEVQGEIKIEQNADVVLSNATWTTHDKFKLENNGTLTQTAGLVRVADDVEVKGDWTGASCAALEMFGSSSADIKGDDPTRIPGLIVNKTGSAKVKAEKKLEISGGLQVLSGELDLKSSQSTLTLCCAFKVDGSVDLSDVDVVIDCTNPGEIDLDGGTVKSLTFRNTAEWCVVSPINVSGDLSIESNAVVCVDEGGVVNAGEDLFIYENGTLKLVGGDFNQTDVYESSFNRGNVQVLDAQSKLAIGPVFYNKGTGLLEMTAGEFESACGVFLMTGSVTDVENATLDIEYDLESQSGATISIKDSQVDVSDDLEIGSSNTVTIAGTTLSAGDRLEIGSSSIASVSNSNLDFGGCLSFFSDSTNTFTNSTIDTDDEVHIYGGATVSVTGGDFHWDDDVEIKSNGTLSITNSDGVFDGINFYMRSSSVFNLTNTSLEVDGDVETDASSVINHNGGLVRVGDEILVNGLWNSSGDAAIELFDSGHSSSSSSVIDSSTSDPLNLPSLKLNKGSGSLTLGVDIYVSGNFEVVTGAWDSGTGNHDITVTGDATVDNSANSSFNGREGTLTMTGADDAELSVQGNTIYRLVIQASGAKCIVSDIVISNAFDIESGGNACLENGATFDYDSSTNDFGLAGIFTMQSGTTLELEDGSQIDISSGGLLVTTGTSSVQGSDSVAIEAEASGGDWMIVVGSGASVALAGAYLSDGVIDVDASASVVTVSETTFTSMPAGAGDAFIDLRDVTLDGIVISNTNFVRGSSVAAGTARNIRANATTSEVYVVGGSGNLYGEPFDADPAGRVYWVNSAGALNVTGASISNMSSLNEVNAFLPTGSGDVVTVSRHSSTTVNAAAVTVSAFAQQRSTFVVKDFAGTLNIDGMIFKSTIARSVIIDCSNVTSGGTINFYNCIFVDAKGGASRPLIVSGTATVNFIFCTVDSDAGSTGHSGTATSTIFARETGFDTGIFIDYAINASGNFRDRNLRLGGLDANVTSAAPDATFSRDIDGKPRPNPTTIGAHHFDPSYGAKVQVTDVTDPNGTGRNTAIAFTANQLFNFFAGGSYVTGTDGTNCYITLLSSGDVKVKEVVSWPGNNLSNVAFVQCSDDGTKFWLCTPYDSDEDGSFDKIRHVLHETTGAGMIDKGDMTVLQADGVTPVNFNDEDEWEGQIFLQAASSTGGPGVQVTLSTTQDGGELFTYYFNHASTSGQLFSNTSFTGTPGQAIQEFKSQIGGWSSKDIAPNEFAPALMYGSESDGRIIVTRFADADYTAALAQLDRATGQIVNQYIGPGIGESFSTSPYILFNASNRRTLMYADQPKVVTFDTLTWSGVQELDIGLTGYGAPYGTDPQGFFLGGVTYVPMYNPETGLGAVVATEYNYSQNGGTTFEVLDGSYSDPKLRFDAGAPGFEDGIAHVIGKPIRLLQLPAKNEVYCATDAGWVYGWKVSGILPFTDTSIKGARLEGFPMELPIGGVSGLTFANVSDATLKSELGMTADGQALAIFGEGGQIILVRID